MADRMHQMLKLRNVVRPGFLAFLCLAALVGWGANACYLKIGYLRILCPAGFLEIAAVTRSIPWHLLPGFILVVLVLVFGGRVWCGWFCNVSFLSEKAENISRGNISPVCLPRKPKKAKLVVGIGDAAAITGGLFAGMLIFGYPLFCLFCPVGIISRNIISFFTSWNLRFDLVLLAVPVLAGMVIDFRKAPLCPAGLIRALLSTNNHTMIPIVTREKCIDCGQCEKECPAGLNPSLYVDPAACIKCLNCIDVCPTGAMELQKHCGKCNVKNN